MSSLFGIGAGSASTGFYPETIDQSLRFEDGDSPYLTRTPASAGSRTTWTWSAWIKRGLLTTGSPTMFSSATNYDQIRFDASDRIIFAVYSNNGATNVGTFTTKQNFRDTTNWYHVVCVWDTTNATAGDRQRIYINGKRVLNADLTITATPSSSAVSNFNNEQMSVGRRESTNNIYMDGYMAEVNFLDGTAVSHTQDSNGDYILDEFGQLKNSVWIPKAYSGSYGTNGFRLTFADSSSLGDDTSGNGNDYTSTGLASTDVVTDSPTNNFCTINANRESTVYNGSVTLSEGNLQSVDAGTTYSLHWTGTFGMSTGKWYWEVLAHTMGGSSANIGICNILHRVSTAGTGVFYGNDGARNPVTYFTGQTTYGDSYTSGDIIGIAFDADNETVTFYKNNSSQGAVGSVLVQSSGPYFAAAGDGQNATTYKYVINFGQDSSFAGNKTAQGNTDDNGVGDFYYSPPSGYLALCSSNLPDTTISPSKSTQADDHFNTVLYTGNGTTDRAIDVGFATDWFWVKQRSGTNVHQLTDTSRGALKGLNSDQSAIENTFDSVRSFTSTGVTVGTSATTNSNGATYVAWNWKAGGTAPTKTYKVVVVSDSGNKYRFRNSADSATFAQSAVTLDLQEGGTYVFDWSDSTAQGHPIRFSLTSDGTHGGGSEYTTGVVKDDSGYKTTITVASGVATLYYYCQNHSGMGGQINTNTTHGSTNFDGSILSVSQTNETAGFSIVTYTGTGTNGETVGHGLGLAPSVCIIKSRTNSGYEWAYWHKDLTSGSKLYWNSTSAEITGQSMFNNSSGTHTIPTSTLLTLSGSSVANYALVNNSGSNHIAYIFAEVEGYSKFGSYTGNNSTDGTYVFTGFRVAFIMLKRSSSTGGWQILDNKRNTFNTVDRYLLPNLSNSEYDGSTLSPAVGVDFLSNGFKLRTTEAVYNSSGGTFIYMAFSDGQNFKFSNAR